MYSWKYNWNNFFSCSLCWATQYAVYISGSLACMRCDEVLTTWDVTEQLVFQTEQFVMLWFLFALIVLGNSAVLAALLLDRGRAKSRMNFFIMHLALAGGWSSESRVAKYSFNRLTGFISSIAIENSQYPGGSDVCNLNYGVRVSRFLKMYNKLTKEKKRAISRGNIL